MGTVPRSPGRPWHPPHTLFPLKEELLLDATPPHLDATELGTHTRLSWLWETDKSTPDPKRMQPTGSRATSTAPGLVAVMPSPQQAAG